MPSLKIRRRPSRRSGKRDRPVRRRSRSGPPPNSRDRSFWPGDPDPLLQGLRAAGRRTPIESSSASHSGPVREGQRDPPVGEDGGHPGELDVHDLRDVGARERAERDHIVDPVQELGTESGAQRAVHFLARALRVVAEVSQGGAGEVRRHDEDRVPEVHGAALAVCQTPIVEDLQQDVEDVLVRLLDLVEEQHGVRSARTASVSWPPSSYPT